MQAANRVHLPITAAGLLLLIGLIAVLAAFVPTQAQAQDSATKPRNLTAAILSNGIKLTWNAPTEQADSITGYEILRRRPAEGENTLSALIADTGSTATTYTDTSATVPGVKYVYRVKAIRDGARSQPSNYVNPTVPQPTPTPEPSQTPEPSGLKPTGLGVTLQDSIVTLSWTAPAGRSSEVTGYEILRRKPLQGETSLLTLVADTQSTDTSYGDQTANEASVRYVYRVKAIRGTEKSQWSNYARITLPDDYEQQDSTNGDATNEDSSNDDPTSDDSTSDDSSADDSSSQDQTPTPTPEPTTAPTPEPTPEPTPTATPEPATTEGPIYYVNPGPGPLTGFSIVDASDQETVTSFSRQAKVELENPDGGSYALRVNYEPGVVFIRSVHMVLTGTKSHTTTENQSPYSLFGDSGLTLKGEAMPEGDYTIKVTAYSEPDQGGHTYGSLETTFTVVQSSESETETEQTAGNQQALYQPEEFDCTGTKKVCMRAQSRTISEGDPINLTMRLSESHDSDLRVTFQIYYPKGTIDTSGFYGVDTSGAVASANRDFTFPAGSTVQTLSVPTIEDEDTNQNRTQHLLAYIIAPFPWDESPSLGLNLKYVDDDLPPGKPRNLRAISRAYHVELHWDPPANVDKTGLSHYEVGVDYGSPIGPHGNLKRFWYTNVGERQFATEYKPSWDTYKYVVRAVNKHGESQAASVNAMTHGAPWQPIVSANAGNESIAVSIDLQDCDVPNQLVTEFQVQWKSGDQDYDSSRQMSLTQDRDSGATFARITIENLTNGTEYTVRARTINEFGRGPWSNLWDSGQIVKVTPRTDSTQ